MQTILFDFFRKKIKPQPVILGLQDITFNGQFVSDVTEIDYQILLNDIQYKIQEVYASEQKLDAIKNFGIKVNEVYKNLCSCSLNQKELINISEIKLVQPHFTPQNNPIAINKLYKREKILDNIKAFYGLQNDEKFLFLDIPDLNNLLVSKEYKYLKIRDEVEYITEKIEFDFENVKEEDLYFIYSLGHLRYVLDLHKEFLLKILQFIDEFKEFSENNTQEEKIDDKNGQTLLLNKENFYLNLKKKEVAVFFKLLHELQWIGNINKRQKSSETTLKSFLNNSNSYYLGDDDEYHPIKNIGREFSDISLTEKKEMFQHQEIIENEIEFIKFFRETLDTKLEKLEVQNQQFKEKLKI